MISTKEEKRINKQYIKNLKKLQADFRYSKKNTDSFIYDIAIVCIAKNESKYLKEWIEYHMLIGVSKFYIYDHESNDDTLNVLQPYIDNGIVVYNYIETPNSKQHHPQIQVYTDAVCRYKNYVKWMAFIDIDEFIVPENGGTLNEVLDFLDKKYKIYDNGGLAINWLVYGSSNFDKKPSGLVIENYNYRAKDSYEGNENIKCIVNPRLIKNCGIHQPSYFDNFYTVNECGKKIGKDSKVENSHKYIRINHYSSKSKEEFKEREQKGFGGASSKHLSHDMNDIYDPIMEIYVSKLKNKRKENELSFKN